MSDARGQSIRPDITETPRIRTFTGRLVNPLDLQYDDIAIADVAHALSNLCRFAGHTRAFYSVAQHSVLVADALLMTGNNGESARWGLLHDASEAYLIDLPRPLKKNSPLGAIYEHYEARAMAIIAARFGLPAERPAEIDYFDKVLVETERRDLVNTPTTEFKVPLLIDRIVPLPPPEAEALFLKAFEVLFGAEAAA